MKHPGKIKSAVTQGHHHMSEPQLVNDHNYTFGQSTRMRFDYFSGFLHKLWTRLKFDSLQKCIMDAAIDCLEIQC